LIEGERDSSTGKFLKLIAINDSTEGDAIATDEDLNNRSLNIPRQAISHNKIASDNTFILRRSRLSVLLAYQHNSRKEFGMILDPDAVGLHFSLKSYTYDLKYFLPEIRNWQFTIGTNGMFQQNKNLGEEVLIPAYQQIDVGVFAYVKKEITSKLNVAGGLRFDNRKYKNEELMEDGAVRFKHLDKSFGNLSGSLGITYSVNKGIVIKTNIARGYRAPQAAELSSNGRHEGTFRYELGNSDLKPETSLQADLGVLFNSKHLSIDAALFSNNIDNFVYLEKLGSLYGGDSITDPSDPAPTFKFVQGKAALNGAELTIDIHPHPLDWLHFENTFSYVNAINKNQADSSKYLPFTPATRITSELRADFKKLNTNFVNFYVLINAQVYLEQDHILLENGTETPTPGYTLYNAATGCDIKGKKNKAICSFVLAANNITNVAYQSHLSRLKYAPLNYATGRSGVYNMGRNISLKVLVPLNFKS
jgi:iron complex outermembrane receptor protein